MERGGFGSQGGVTEEQTSLELDLPRVLPQLTSATFRQICSCCLSSLHNTSADVIPAQLYFFWSLPPQPQATLHLDNLDNLDSQLPTAPR